MASMHPVVECVAGFLAARHTGPDTAVMVGCSGGADSMALAHACATLKRAGRLGVVTLVYVDHQLRPGSAADGAVVARAAAQLGVEAVTEPVVVARDRASLEEAARTARYAGFERLAARLGVAAVLLAHTRTDQAETVLMRLLRGTGVVGLAAIPAERGRYWRPLLGVTREQTEGYCADHGLATLRDPMNDDERFLRVRVRRHLMPALARENPAIEAALARVARAAAEHKQVWDFAAAALLEQASAGAGAESIIDARFRIEPFADAPAGVAKCALSLAAIRAGGRPLDAKHQQQLLELVQRPAAGTICLDLPDLRAVREYGRLRFEASTVPPVIKRVQVTGLDEPYEVRVWRAGDRMRPARLKGRSRKLSDLFSDAKVPRALRHDAVVIARRNNGEIVWAEFLGRSFGCEVEVTLTSQPPMATNND